MKTKKPKKEKLVFGNYKCLQQWINRTIASPDPDNDPSVRVMSAPVSPNYGSQWTRETDPSGKYPYGNIVYTEFHMLGSPDVRKIESHGCDLVAYGCYNVAQFIGTQEEPFYLINYDNCDSQCIRIKTELYQILGGGHSHDVPHDLRKRFAIIPSMGFAERWLIRADWGKYLSFYKQKIQNVYKANPHGWLAVNLDLCLDSLTREYVNLGTFVNASPDPKDLEEECEMARKHINTKRVLAKLKEK
jgi:hypothetical protein